VKKQIAIMGIAAALVLGAVVGGTIAAPTIKADNDGTTTVQIQDLDVALAASAETETATSLDVKGAVPGQEVTYPDYIVKNVKGYDLYTRVVIDKQWKNADGTTDLDLNPSYIHAYYSNTDEYANKNCPEGWILAKNTDEQIILYYTKPLKAEEKTTAFLTKLLLDSKMDNAYTDKNITVTITVNAVQAAVAEKSMLAEWGVKPTFDEAGVITAITE